MSDNNRKVISCRLPMMRSIHKLRKRNLFKYNFNLLSNFNIISIVQNPIHFFLMLFSDVVGILFFNLSKEFFYKLY